MLQRQVSSQGILPNMERALEEMMNTHYRRNVYRKSQCMRGRTGQVSSLEISSMVMERGKNKWAMI